MVFRTTKAPDSRIPFPTSGGSSGASRRSLRLDLVGVAVVVLALSGLVFWLVVVR
jgi:hypothetical protein